MQSYMWVLHTGAVVFLNFTSGVLHKGNAAIFSHKNCIMQRTVYTLFLSLFSVCALLAQQPQKIVFNSSDTLYGYYTITIPQTEKKKVLLVLMDGYGGNAVNFLTETGIDEAAYKKNIVTLCIPTGPRLYADTNIVALLNKAISQTLATYNIPKTKLVMGGFSSGGTILLRYAQMCSANPALYPAVPKMLFTCDSPVDLAGLYHSASKQLTNNFTGWWLDEARMIIDKLHSKFGEPATNKKAWQSINPFNSADTAAGNEKYLKGIAYRTYHDVDVEWQLQNRGRSLYHVNALDASELISRLQLGGHKNAQFIQSKIPGRRSNGQRHPHSWNIIDAAALMQWIEETMQ